MFENLNGEMKNRNILISGAGIAGLALAYWLRRYNFNPTVVERASALRDGDYKVDIRGAAVEAIKNMGILADVRQSTVDMQGASFVDRTGGQPSLLLGALFGGGTFMVGGLLQCNVFRDLL